jgi:iron complex outermembrane recepter protein
VKKFFKYSILIFSILFSVIGFAQNTSISGVVYDKYSSKPLKNAVVKLSTLKTSVTTDDSGFFGFHGVPDGNYMLKVSFVGYRDTTVNIEVKGEQQILLAVYLSSGSVEMAGIIVVATRTPKNIKDIPASTGIVTQEQLNMIPYLSTDEYLNTISGISAERHYGIFYKSGDIVMRGLNRNVYSLFLIDGIPSNIVDGGASSWNRIIPDEVKKIEVIKGPGSMLYGTNALGGVVNVITKRPTKPFKALVEGFYGTYNTMGASSRLSFSQVKNDKGFFGGVDFYYRKSNGYVMMVDSLRDSTDIATDLKQCNSVARLGYRINKNHSFDLQYKYSYDYRGLGTKIYDTDGNYDKYNDNTLQLIYNGQIKKFTINGTAFYSNEFYNNQKESLKQNGMYTLFNTETFSQSKGAWISASRRISALQEITFGLDTKFSGTESSDIYRTSTDTLNNTGNLDFIGLFLQDDINLCKNKLKVIAGVRFDYVRFSNGKLEIDEPSATTSYMLPYLKSYTDKTWNALSPKLGLRYNFKPSFSTYISVSKGFRAASISDLSRSGDVNKGFKIANPDLKPEYISNVETGINVEFFKKISAEAVAYYSRGTDFQYFIGTGDSIITTKTKKQPIIIRKNISKVNITGVELSANFKYSKNLTILANYTCNSSKIAAFDTTGYFARDLSGKYLTDVPINQGFFGILYKYKKINTTLICKMRGSTWADDENTIKNDGYTYFNMNAAFHYKENIELKVTVENIFNSNHPDSKGLLSPGRFVTAAVSIEL